MGTITKVVMNGCDGSATSDHCAVQAGTTPEGQITFTSNVPISSMKCEMSASLFPGISIPCPTPDGCKSLASGDRCPIAANTEVVYNLAISVEPISKVHFLH